MSLYVQMDSSIPILTSITTITLFFFFLTTLLPQSACHKDDLYWICSDKASNCGNLTNISYTFLGQNRSHFCGRAWFECVDNQITISVNWQSFTVLEINPTDHRRTMVPETVLDQACPSDYAHSSLNPNLFMYAPTVHNVSIFYNCSPEFSNGGNHFSCGEDSEEKGFHGKENMSWIQNCGGYTQVPPMQPIDWDPAGGIDPLKKARKDGFNVQYNFPGCSECEKPGGVCGSSEYSAFFCYKPELDAASPPNKTNWKRKIIIGVVAAGIGALSLSIAFFFYLRRKKNHYAASYMQSRSLSADPSLKDDPEKGSKYFGVHVFTYIELEEATNNFDSNRELGDGGFGTVYFGKLRDGRQVAVKRLYKNNYRRLERFMNEVEILTRLCHQNLVSLYGCTSPYSRELLLVYEYIPNGTLADHLHGGRAKPGPLTWDIRMSIALETACALAYLHASDIIHRDVKTNNILLDNHFVVKVADFGLSRLFPNDVTHISTAPQGTPGYVDPEYHQCYQLTDRSDVYSFGVVLIELISSMLAVDITRHRHEINLSNMAINKIQNRALHELVDPSLGFESDDKVRKMINAVAELAFQCLQNLKDLRPSMEEVVERLQDIQNEGKSKIKAEEIDIPAAEDAVLLKNEPPPASPDSNARSTSTTSNASG